MATTTKVTSIPACDLDNTHGPAYADASIPAANGSWAYVCRPCFDRFGCSLGTGFGQQLLKREVTA